MTDKRINIIIDSAQAEKNAKSLDDKVSGVGRSADKSSRLISELESQISATAEASKKTDARIDELTKGIDSLKDESRNAENSVKGLREDINQLNRNSSSASVNANKLNNSIGGVSNRSDQASFKINRLAFAIKSAIVGGALYKAVGVLVQAQREFDRLNASLITATGSADLAVSAFADIERLASTTPYSVEQVTEAFIKLRNLGLDPSEEAIISYGNTAAAMGKDLSQLIEAVADATTGEFERLKEFGIKARNEGEQIALTFQGTTERIANNAQAIEQYLQSLGNDRFAGAINARLQTLDGAVSNLGDAWGSLVRAVGASGLSDSIERAVRFSTEGIQELTGAIRSGQLQQVFGAWSSSFEGFANDFTGILNAVLSVYRQFTEDIGSKSGSISGFLGSAFLDAGPNIRAFIQLMTVEVAGAIDRVVAYASYLKTAVSDFGFSEASAQLEADLERINSVRMSSIGIIVSEAEAVKASTAAQIEAAKQLRLEFEKSSGGGGLGQFQIQGEGDEGGNKKADKFAADLAAGTATLKRELELRRNISQIYRQGELDAEASQFERERALNEVNEQTRLAELQAKYEEDVARRQFQFSAKLESLVLEEEQRKALQDEFDLQELTARKIHEEQKTAIEQSAARDRMKIAEMERAARIDTWSSMAQSGLKLIQAFGNDSFQSQKNFAIGEGIVNVASAVIKALNNPYPANLAFAAQVGLQGAALIKNIRSARPSSGGGAPSAVGTSSPVASTASSVQAAPTQQPTQIRFVIENDVMGIAEKLNDSFKELQRNGVEIAGASRA